MKAWIVQFWWMDDPSVVSSIVFFGDTRPEIERAAVTHSKVHGIDSIERAPWLDKPE